MSNMALVSSKKYEGKYVAMESFTNFRVVASGKDLNRVLNSADKKGFPDPVIAYIPPSDMACIY